MKIKLSIFKCIACIVVFIITTAKLSYSRNIPGDSTSTKKNVKVIFLPAIIRSPETKWGFGGVNALTFRVRRSDTLTRTSSIQALGLYTTRKQTITGLDASIFFPQENYIFRFHSSYTLYPDKYWGLGNRTDMHKPVAFTYQQFYIFPQLLRRVYKNLYAGVSLEYQRIFKVVYNKNDFYDYDKVVGLKGGVIPGAGVLATWDSRNNAFSPTQGEFLEFSVTKFNNHIQDYVYTNFILDVRKYIETTANHQVLAFQFYGNFNKGSIPILSLAAMGGNTIMRGYYSGRFRDKDLVATQVEYRMPVYKRIGVVGFAAVGQVTKELDDINVYQFKYAIGGGLRIALKPEERLNLRIDYGVAPHSRGLYLTVAEAF